MKAAEFLRLSLSVRFEWGVSDCALWAADFPRLATGHDPAAHLRGTYNTRLSCFQVLRQAGGLRSVARSCMDHPMFGPLQSEGIAVAGVDGRQMCGVVSEGLFFVLTDRNSIRLVRNPVDMEGWSWSKR